MVNIKMNVDKDILYDHFNFNNEKAIFRAINIFLVCKALGKYFLTQRTGKIIGFYHNATFSIGVKMKLGQ
jgi:hypothetical protein